MFSNTSSSAKASSIVRRARAVAAASFPCICASASFLFWQLRE
jgi:hypothetical protein